MRIAIVNDVAGETAILRRVVESAGRQVCWTASTGPEALEKCAADLPDLVLLDVVMPGMDGAQTTCAIMKRSPCAILLVTPSVTDAAGKVFEAMALGALDAVATPMAATHGVPRGAEELLRKIGTIARLVGQTAPRPATPERKAPTSVPPLLAIGASTGGPGALAAVLSALPSSLEAAIVIVQHVDARFAGGLADWLARQTPAPVRVAREGERPEAGVVLVAATNDHLEVGPSLTLRYTPDPVDYPYRPSVDSFFLSVARHWPRRDVAILLTGMGRDGARGLLALKEAGWHTIAQDEQSSIVYGMPKAAAELGAAREVLALERIGNAAMLKMGR